MKQFVSANSSVKRKQKLYKDLLEVFGADNKTLIESEICKAETYLKDGYLYSDVFNMTKDNIFNVIQATNTGRKSRICIEPKLTIKSTRNFSPNSNVSMPHASLSKRSHELPDYSDKYSRFYEESSNFDKNFENFRSLGFVRRPTLQISEKIDEVRALEAAREREEQARFVEYQRETEKIAAEKEISKFHHKQIKEKAEFSRILMQQDKVYAKQLEDRKKFMERVETDEWIRQKQNQKAYLRALDDQISHQNSDKAYIRNLDYQGKKILTPEPYDSGKTSPVSMSPSSESNSYSIYTQRESPIKFLAKYGNFILSKPKK